jgi:hypothetical protein
MSRIITLIVAVGAALAVAVPVAGARPDPWSNGMNQRYELGEYAPEVRAERLRSEGLNKLYGLGEFASAKSIDAREVGMAIVHEDPTTAMLNAREQSLGTERIVRLSNGTPPDVFERAVAARRNGRSDDHLVANDKRVGFEPTNQPAPVSATGSGDEIQWPQVGAGFGIGVAIALLLGLLLAQRVRRHPPLAH